MAANTWNFQVHEARDWPENPSGRGQTAGIFYTYGTTSTGFTSAFTAIFSVLIRSGWTAEDGFQQILFSLGKRGAYHSFINITGTGTASTRIGITLHNVVSGTKAYELHLGDEDGSSKIASDKWYQVAFSANTSGATYAVNGTSSPLATVSTDNLSVLDVANAEIIALFGGISTASKTNIQQSIYGHIMPSVMVGPAAYSNQLLDLNDSAVLARIYDDNGDFRNPGEDGSLWFGDTYGANTPEYYFATGTPRGQKGTDATAWYVGGGNNYTGRVGAPGGLRKQYE